MKKYSVIVVNYNGASTTKNLINSLSSQVGLNENFHLECIVVDNSCCAAEQERLRSIGSGMVDLVLIAAEKNVGYFHGLNLGIEIAKNEYLIIGNNDLVFDVNFFNLLASRRDDGSIFALAPNIVTVDGRSQNPHMAQRITRFHLLRLDIYYSAYWIGAILSAASRLFGRDGRRLPNIDDEIDIHMGIGACYILTPEFSKRFAALSYPGFLYGEEAFFAKQIHDAGGRMLYVPSLKITHAESVSTSVLPRKTVYDWSRAMHRQNRLFL